MITFTLTQEEANTIAQVLDFARKNCPIEQVRALVDLFEKLKELAKESGSTKE